MNLRERATRIMMSTSPLNAERDACRRSNQGFSLVEALIAITITLTILSLVMSFAFQSWRNQSFVATQSQLKQHAESGLFKISNKLAEAKILFEEDTEGTAYRNKIAFAAGQPTPVANTYLPTIRGSGSVYQERNCEADAQQFFWAPSVGNSLFFTTLEGIFDMEVSNVSLSATALPQVLDLYRFKYYYLSDNYSPPGGQPINISRNILSPRPALQIMDWTSALYVDYDQLKSFFDLPGVTSSDKSAVISKLSEANVVAVWKKGEANPNQAFFNLNAALSSKAGSYRIQNAQITKLMPWTNSSSTIYSVAYNRDVVEGSPTFFKIKSQVPMFFDNEPPEDCGTINPAPEPPVNSRPDTDYPLGFEVAIVGPNSGRTVHMHLTLVGQTNHPQIAEHVHSLSAYARDL